MSGMARFAGNLARYAARTLVRFYYPKLQIADAERIPRSGPVLFVANHPNSLIDPILIGIAAQRPVRYLAKAPLFEVPVLGHLMRALGMVPAFRASDDAAQVSRNTDSLAAGAEILVKGEALGIFPEGKTHDAAKLEMVRSGASRIVMQAVKSGAKDLRIVPVGINFEAKEIFRSAVWIRIGEPLDVSAWLAQQETDESKATRRLTAEIERRLKDLVVHLSDEKLEPLLQDLDVLLPRSETVTPATPDGHSDPVAALRQRKRIADGINYFLAGDRARAGSLMQEIQQHRNNAAALRLDVRSPILSLQGWPLLVKLIKAPLWLALFFVPALIGTLHHLLPFALVRAVAPRVQTPGRTTVSLARLGLSLPIYGLWYAAVAWRMSTVFLPWVIWAWLLPMPLLGILALEYCARAKHAALLWWMQVRLLFSRGELAELQRAQANLRQRLKALSDEYARVYPRPPEPVRTVAPRKIKRRALAWTGAALAAAALAITLWQFRAIDRAPLAELSMPGPRLSGENFAVLEARVAADETALLDIVRGLSDLEARALQVRDEFAAGKRSYYTQADNDAVRQLLLSYLNYRAALFRIIWKYQDHPGVRDERLRLRVFLVDIAAAAVLYESSLKFVTQFNRSGETVKKLNEAEPLWEIPPGVYDTIRRNMACAENCALLEDAMGTYRKLQPEFEQQGLAAGEPYVTLHAVAQSSAENSAALARELWREKLSLSARGTRKVAGQTYYQVQSMLATWIGDTKIRAPRDGQTLIGKEQLDEFRTQLKPGDILLERRNWFLSNAFLPGYWPHAAMYVGTPDELKAMGLDKDPRVAKHWAEFSTPDEHGHAHVIVEALSEGVVCATLEHSIGGGDCAVALRPRLSEERIKEAICLAFSHKGKPYDFEFDFFSTDKIVCTELVFRCYDGAIKFPLVDVMGRKTMPAIEIVRKFVSDRDAGTPELEFVAFLDGDEATGTSRFADENSFCSTLRRPAMTWLQGLVPER